MGVAADQTCLNVIIAGIIEVVLCVGCGHCSDLLVHLPVNAELAILLMGHVRCYSGQSCCCCWCFECWC